MGILIFVRTKQIDVTLDLISDEAPGRKKGGHRHDFQTEVRDL